MMQGSVQLMRIYVSSTDKVDHVPLYEAIIFLAKKEGLKGATAIKGVMGFGSSSAIESTGLWDVTEKTPVIVEVVDTPEKIAAFSPMVKELLEASGKGCLAIVQNFDLIHYSSGKK